MAEQDWSKVERTQDLVEYVYDKYGNVPVTDEMLDDLYNFAMLKVPDTPNSLNGSAKHPNSLQFVSKNTPNGLQICSIEKYLSMVESDKKAKLMVESEKGKAKLMVSDEMVEYVLAKVEIRGKVDDLQNRISKLEVDLAWAIKAKQAEHDKGKAKQAEHDLDDVDLNHVDLDGLDLENRVKKLKEEFSRMLKANKANEAKEKELKMNEEVVQVSNDEGFSSDEDVVCFNDVKYPLTDVEIRMFKERPTTSRAPTASTFAFKASTRSKAPIASTSNTQDASTSALRVYRRIAMTGCVLGLRALDDPNAPLPSAHKKRCPALALDQICCMLMFEHFTG
ncbi:hypothetical protein Tco_1162023 [Tanacetum coccineum]